MENSQEILQGSSDMEKGAYLGAIASIATADRQATPEEVEFISALADSAGLSDEQKEAVMKAANEISDNEVLRCLDVLKGSDLRFSLVTDVIAFAKSDNNYSEEEQKSVQKMANYLGVNQEQFSLLDNFAEKAQASASSGTSTMPAQAEPNDFLSSLGLKDKLQSAGINGGSLLKGILGIAAPMLLAKMVTGGLSRNRGGGMFGGGSGGMFGGGGGMFGGSGGMLGGGLGSVFSMLNGNRGFQSSGGLLSRVLRGGF